MRPRTIILGALALAGIWSYAWVRPRSGSRPTAPVARPGDERRIVLLTDDLERTVPVRVPARRIASLHPAFTEMLEALGAGSNVVGATGADAARLGVPALGSHVKPDLEAILACQPDVILLAAARQAGLATAIESRAAAAGAAVLAWRPATVEQALARLREAGRLTGRESAALALAGRAEASLAEVAAAIAAVPEDRRPRVFLEVRATPALLTCGRESVAFDIIRLAGGRLVADLPGAVVAVDLEAVVQADPDVYLQQQGVMNPDPAPVSDHAVLGQLRAVREGRIHRLEESLLSRPGPRVAEAVMAVHALLYPDS
jgi:iron complex transport system substrate-binding protein